MNGYFIVVSEYFGKFDCKHGVCHTDSLSDAILITNLLIDHFAERPFKFSIVYTGSDLDDVLESFAYDGIRDLNDYFNGIYCI